MSTFAELMGAGLVPVDPERRGDPTPRPTVTSASLLQTEDRLAFLEGEPRTRAVEALIRTVKGDLLRQLEERARQDGSTSDSTDRLSRNRAAAIAALRSELGLNTRGGSNGRR